MLLPRVGERKWFRCLMSLCGVSGRSLGGKLPWHPSCSPLWDNAPASCSPEEGTGAAVGGEGQSVLSSPTPLQPSTKRERAEGTLWGLSASLAGEISSKLRTLAAASCAACQNLLWGLSQTYFVQQWGSLSEHRYSFTLYPGSTNVLKSCSSITYLVEPQWRKWLWLGWCNIKRMRESTHSIASWGSQCNWKKTLILKGIMEKHFFYFALRLIVNKLLFWTLNLVAVPSVTVKMNFWSLVRGRREDDNAGHTQRSQRRVRSLQPPRGEDTGSHHLGAEINAAVVAGWENLNLKQILSTPISYWLILTWHQIKITSPKSICLLRQNNSSQTILSVMEWQYHLHQNQENKDRHAHGHNKEQNPLCSALSILNMLEGASIICKRSNNLLWNYGHMILCLYNLRETPRNPTSLLHLLDWAKWSTMNLTQRPPKLPGAKDL